MVRGILGGVAAVLACAACVGCTIQTSDADRFRGAVPQASDVALAVPGSGGTSSGTSSQSLKLVGSNVGIRDLNGASTAQYYQFTRNITDAVDFTTAIILGGIITLVNFPPTSVSGSQAVWGPGQGDALDPVSYRFTVTEVATNEYDYKLEGRPSTSSSDADWLTVLSGHGFGKEAGAQHRTGYFTADNDAYRTLEPSRGHDYGKTTINFDLQNLDDPSKAGTINVDIEPNNGTGNAQIVVSHEPQGAGGVAIAALAALDNSQPTVLENISMNNRWDLTGAGRADVHASGGALSSELDATECWSSSFARVYYTDNLNAEPTSGNPASCAFGPSAN